MTREQKRKVIGVIQNDAEGRFKYINENGQTCAVGGLLRALGWDDEALKHLGVEGPLPRELLREHYGLPHMTISDLIDTNDAYSVLDERRKALIKIVERVQESV